MDIKINLTEDEQLAVRAAKAQMEQTLGKKLSNEQFSELLMCELAEQALPPEFDLIAHLHRQRQFSLDAFGPGDRLSGVTKHIEKELAEVLASGGALDEWVDVILLALDGAWRSGARPEDIAKAIAHKQDINERRDWPDWRGLPKDQPIEHLRLVQE